MRIREASLQRVSRASLVVHRFGAAIVLAGMALSGCGGASASAKASASTEDEVNFDVEGDAAWDTVSDPAEMAEPELAEPEVDASANPDEVGPPQGEVDSEQPAAAGLAMKKTPDKNRPALLGARHDVYLDPGLPATCRCLAVVVGQPSDDDIKWSGPPPRTSASSQLVVALSSAGVACDDKAAEASYMGYQVEAGNVVIQVEAATKGRPITRGAIVPRPTGEGKILVRGVDGVPYATDKGGCQVHP